jgi:hypothetical protein
MSFLAALEPAILDAIAPSAADAGRETRFPSAAQAALQSPKRPCGSAAARPSARKRALNVCSTCVPPPSPLQRRTSCSTFDVISRTLCGLPLA